MITISTHQGKQVEIVLESELRAPMERGAHVRAYCHLHGSDHQRSLSITKATGWGHCFNAACGSASLTLLRYDLQRANEAYLLFYGQLAEHDDEWSFTPSRVALP